MALQKEWDCFPITRLEPVPAITVDSNRDTTIPLTSPENIL